MSAFRVVTWLLTVAACRLLLLNLGLANGNGALLAQTPAASTGAVQGHVLGGDTQQPARLAHVVLQPLIDVHASALDAQGKPEGIFHLQTVGLDGSFIIPNVPQGLYYVIAEQDGYISPLTLFTRDQLNHPDPAMLSRITRFMSPVSVTAGHTTQVEMRLIRGATLSGTVRFEDGSPAVNVGMAALHRDATGKWVTLRLSGLASHGSTYTNDRGAHRFSGLPAGEYLVRASIGLNHVVLDHIFSNGGSTSYQDGYHLRIFPGDTFRPRDAKLVKVEEGQDVAALDIDVPLSTLYTVSGTVMHPDGSGPVNAAEVTLRFGDNGEELVSTDVDSDDGSFRFDFVPGGTYTLSVSHAADVRRWEEPTCRGCMPPSTTQSKVVTSYGDAKQPMLLTGNLTGVVVTAGARSTAPSGPGH